MKVSGSRAVSEVTRLSHSFAVNELKYMYRVLGDLSGKVVVDVGSRLGAVLFAGYYMSDATRLVGIEISEWFHQLQSGVVQR